MYVYERVAPTHVGHIEAPVPAEPSHDAVQKPFEPGLAIIGTVHVVAATPPAEVAPPRHAAPIDAPEQPEYGARPHSPSLPHAAPDAALQAFPEQHA